MKFKSQADSELHTLYVETESYKDTSLKSCLLLYITSLM